MSLCFLAQRTIEAEEVADRAVSLMLLEEEDKLAVLKRAHPALPIHLLQFLASIARKIEAQYTEVVTVFGAGDRSWSRLALLRPALHDLGTARRQRLPLMVLMLLRRVNPLRALRACAQLIGVLVDELFVVLRKILCRNRRCCCLCSGGGLCLTGHRDHFLSRLPLNGSLSDTR